MIGRPALCLALGLAMSAHPVHAQATRFPSDSIDAFVRSEMARQQIPGMSVAVLIGDSVMLARGYGYANLELRVPATDSTVYQSGSVGKQFTAALVLMLVEQGRLRLDDPIVRFLPEGRARWAGVSIRHLLTHTSGIPDYTDDAVDLHRDYTEDRLVRVAATLPLSFPPGTRWSYSNTGYLLLGALIHRVTGSFYGDVLRDSIFNPLGMPSARVISESDIVPNRAAGYRLVAGAIANQEWVSPSLNTTADGSLYLSLRDYVRWAIALNHEERPSRAVLEMAWTPAPITGSGTYPYGAGWFLMPQRRHRKVGHTGSWQGFQTSIQRYPEYDLTVVALSNLGGSSPGPLSEAIAGIVVPELAEPHTLPPDPRPDSLAARAPAALRSLAAGTTDTTLTTRALRRFSGRMWREELAEEIQPVSAWEVVTCDSLPPGLLMYLGSPVVRTCYLRGTGPGASVIATMYYSADHRIAGVEVTSY
ncbi:MAG TPA: serine hydrolase domain-containing protein [Gemmatimonadales bacterium]